ncbi:hypothetical protein P775_08450 [Puniceibacterium antarcticum]|uniref:Uncharacterized protein n=1 Tax=Puniceibacterium antarcticum TaxID=1206336 RepID=A0A2G8RG72_9RHOB|nr:hypothetical protein [Puniceibacterium antarcticum]PIL20550.1 hypothetical protein P775_08450 [Puniceibacterium antarcticum]
MQTQDTFDRSEDIAEALHEQEGLELALIGFIEHQRLSVDIEQVLFALIHAQGHCRRRAQALTRDIALSDRRTDGEHPRLS